MELILFEDSLPRPLPFYLAAEEWLARKYPGRDFFFAWQVRPTVIVGRNQLLDKEVDVGFCRANGIDICRRKSGGGAVLADMNNIMFSYITSSDSVTSTFSSYTSMVVKSLRALGLDAHDNSRNDVLIGDRKVSGNSFYHLAGRSIVHGTMLYDYDPVLMAGALTPPVSKLRSHGVRSARSRVTTIREHLPDMGMDEFKRHILATIPDGPAWTPDRASISEIEAIEAPYHTEEWIMGRDPRGSLVSSARLDGVGEVSVFLTTAGGRIRDIDLRGDFLYTADISGVLSFCLRGVPYERKAVEEVLCQAHPELIVPGLDACMLGSLMFDGKAADDVQP